jgi:outer membrane biosynthesis protein TonB
VYRRTDELKARGRRIWRAAFLVSLAVHLLIFLIFARRPAPPSPFAAAGPRAADDRAAAAGGGMRVVELNLVAPEVALTPPDPVPTPEVLIEPEPIAEPEPPALEIAALPGTGGAELGIGVETGSEGGDGRGDGGAEDEGRFRVVPPTPRGLILPPGDRPGKVRGKEVAVWVFVTEAGAVVPDSTRLLPSTGDSKFDERLRRQAAQWVFQPALRDGAAVAEWFRYIITL